MQYKPTDIGAMIRSTRKTLGVTQSELALTAGTGVRFISDLEQGKASCELGKTLKVLYTLGIKITFIPPP
jgi:HTH-type transcriptional regulator/antitoxin HipB